MHESLASTFFVTGGTFAAVSAFGILIRRDLSAWKRFLLIGFLGSTFVSALNPSCADTPSTTEGASTGGGAAPAALAIFPRGMAAPVA